MHKGKGKISNNLKKLRQNAGMTQQQLADIVGVTRQTIIAIEANKYSPSLEVAFIIAQVLRVKIDDVFSYSRSP